jgi:gamma-glutamylputrescine oxidase
VTLSYWLDPADSIGSALEADTTADVAVVGGGLCGTSAALTLAEAGVNVVLLEADEIAGQASGRNAGFILQGTAERYDRARVHLGEKRARDIHAWSLENHAQIEGAVQRYSIDCEYRRGGSLQLAGSATEERELAHSAQLLREDGFEAELLDGNSLPEVYRNAGFNMGVLLPQDGELQPARFVRGIARASQTHGARIFEHTRVQGIKSEGAGSVRLQTKRGVVHAQTAIVCTNAWAGHLLPWFAETVDPVRGQMLATHPLPRVFDLPVYADHGYDYWRQDQSGRIVLGGWRNLDPESERGFDDVLNEDIQARMLEFLHRFAPLADVKISHRWSGVMGFSQDGLPLLGPVPGLAGVLAAAGFTGHGFGFAFLAGQALAKVALEGDHPFVTDLSARRLR